MARVRCLYCDEWFQNYDVANVTHPFCRFYSCRLLSSAESAFCIEGPSPFEKACFYCGSKEKGSPRDNLNHLKDSHHFRDCKQHIFFSKKQFRMHLVDVHLASNGSTNTTYIDALFGELPAARSSVFARIGDRAVKLTCCESSNVHVGISCDLCECTPFRVTQPTAFSN
jgi:hypothetical protein